MSFARQRRISMAVSSAYLGVSALAIGYVFGYHALISCSGLLLLLIAGPAILYSLLFQYSIKNLAEKADFIDPAEYGMSIGTAKFIRAVGLLLPMPFIAYGAFFASGLSYFALDGSPASIARTYEVIGFDERVFGHRMAQREYLRAARVYKWKHNLGLAKMFIGSAIQCAEEHTPNRLATIVGLHLEAARIAIRAEQWSAADCEYTTALQIAEEKMNLRDTDRLVRHLNRRLKILREKHPECVIHPELGVEFVPAQGMHLVVPVDAMPAQDAFAVPLRISPVTGMQTSVQPNVIEINSYISQPNTLAMPVYVEKH